MKPLFVLFLLLPSFLFGQVIDNRDANISHAVSNISVANMKQTVDDLLSFHTRNNLSSITDPKQGIGAAATYLYNRLTEYAKVSEGRLSVERVPYKATAPRTGEEITLENVVGTIRGNDSRVIALLAHYDSRGGNGNDGAAFDGDFTVKRRGQRIDDGALGLHFD